MVARLFAGARAKVPRSYHLPVAPGNPASAPVEAQFFHSRETGTFPGTAADARKSPGRRPGGRSFAARFLLQNKSYFVVKTTVCRFLTI